MLISRTSRLAVEVLSELTGQGAREWMKATELGQRIDAEVPHLKQLLNRLTRAGLVRVRPVQQPATREPIGNIPPAECEEVFHQSHEAPAMVAGLT